MSTRGDYACRALLSLSLHEGEQRPTSVRDTSPSAPAFPSPILEQILLALKGAGLVRSKRGVGGYVLGWRADDPAFGRSESRFDPQTRIIPRISATSNPTATRSRDLRASTHRRAGVVVNPRSRPPRGCQPASGELHAGPRSSSGPQDKEWPGAAPRPRPRPRLTAARVTARFGAGLRPGDRSAAHPGRRRPGRPGGG
ncbi:MAG: Rrf2 family transcriptional regulator [Ilumatobacteraceae bacterium]